MKITIVLAALLALAGATAYTAYYNSAYGTYQYDAYGSYARYGAWGAIGSGTPYYSSPFYYKPPVVQYNSYPACNGVGCGANYNYWPQTNTPSTFTVTRSVSRTYGYVN